MAQRPEAYKAVLESFSGDIPLLIHYRNSLFLSAENAPQTLHAYFFFECDRMRLNSKVSRDLDVNFTFLKRFKFFVMCCYVLSDQVMQNWFAKVELLFPRNYVTVVCARQQKFFDV